MSSCRNLLIGILLLNLVDVDASVLDKQPSRAFGYFIGDVLEQRIRLQSAGRSVELAELPTNKRVGRWLERLSSTLTTGDQDESWLILKYQLINAPSKPVTISLPALSLSVIKGEPLVVSALPISISPLTPTVIAAGVESQLMRPDRQPVPPDPRAPARGLKYMVMALVATIISWSGWWHWRQHTDARRLPFARALRDIRKLDSKQPNEDPHAWFALHRAFNDSAGKAINSSTIADLIQQEPWLKSFESRIDAFYAASAARFFEEVTQPQPFALIDFGKALYLTEKRHSVGHHQAHR